MKKENEKLIGKLVLALFVAGTVATSISGCGRGKAAGLTDIAPGMTSPDLGQTEPGGSYPTQQPLDTYMPGDNNQDGYSDLPQQPTDTPEPLPAPTQPIKPGAPIIMKATPTTLNVSFKQIKAFYVYTKITWQPVSGAAEYWLYKDALPQFIEASRKNAYAVIKTGSVLSGFYDGIQPPGLSGGIMNALTNIVKAVLNPPGVPHKYKIVAADATGNPMSESAVVESIPLPPIPLPALKQPTELNTTTPLFSWADGNVATQLATKAYTPTPTYNAYNTPYTNTYNAYASTPSYSAMASTSSDPDGYFIYVYPSIMSSSSLPTIPTAFALWGSYRSNKSKFARYGDAPDSVTNYPGTLPFNITFPLKAGSRYSWSVVSVKTDTGDMRTAKAISKSWSGYGDFVVTPNAKVTNPGFTASNISRDNWLRRPTYKN